MLKKAIYGCLLLAALISTPAQITGAQDSSDDLSPKTQQYIDNLNEVKEAQNSSQTVNNPPSDNGSSAWSFVFYGALSGATYAFWRWVKRLKDRD